MWNSSKTIIISRDLQNLISGKIFFNVKKLFTTLFISAFYDVALSKYIHEFLITRSNKHIKSFKVLICILKWSISSKVAPAPELADTVQ